MKGEYRDEPNEAPPDYNEATSSSAATPRAGPSTSSSSARFPLDNKEGQQRPVSSYSSGPPKESTSHFSPSWISDLWRKRADARTDEEVKTTVLSLIRDVVKDAASPGSVDVLQSCLTACRSRGISFESLLQQRSIENHIPLYWAIISIGLASTDQKDAGDSLIDFLISFPHTDDARSDIRLACSLNDDNELFQRIRRSPAFEWRSYAEQMINADGQRIDQVSVEQVRDDASGAFRISFDVSDWPRRMRIAQRVSTEFVARGRAWRLTFRVAAPSDFPVPIGLWVVELSLSQGSSPTWLEGRLVIQPARSSLSRRWSNVVVPLKTRELRLGEQQTTLRVELNKFVPEGTALEFDDSPYVTPAGTLHVTGEFKLDRQSPDCVIC